MAFHTNDAVDGSEIRRSPVEVGSWNPIIYQVLAPSQMVLSSDFWNINLKIHMWPAEMTNLRDL